MYKKLYYIHNKSTNPFYNLALEEYILTTKKNMSFLVIWQNYNTVVIGNNQNVWEEVNLDFIKENGISVVRRTTGGGAVYHDMGNINFSFITDLNESEGFTINDFTRPIIKVLSDIGIDAKADGRNDITINGAKISGNAQRIYKNRILHHGTLLFAPDINMLSTQVEPYSLSDDEINDINRLAEEKYSRPEWTFRAVQPMDIKCSAKFDGGIIDIILCVSDNKISQCNIFGDFMSVTDISPLENALVGTEFASQSIKDVLDKLDLKSILGGITSEEFISCIFK